MKIKKTFKVDDKVFAKVKGYPAWPAKVTACNGKKYSVTFYGTGEVANLSHEFLRYFTKNKEKLVKLSKRKDFLEAVEQIEADIAEAGTDGDEEENTPDISVKSNDDANKQTNKRKRSVSSNEPSPKGTKLPRRSSVKNGIEAKPNKKDEESIKEEAEVPEVHLKKSEKTPEKADLKKLEEDDSRMEVDSEERLDKDEKKSKMVSEQNGQEEKGFQLEDKSLKPTDGNKLNKSPKRTPKKKTPSPKKQRKSTDSNKANESLQDEIIDESEEATKLDNIQLISDVYIKVYTLYAEKVQEKEDIYKDKKPDLSSLEDETDKRCKVLPVKLPSQKYTGIKFILPDISKYDSEFERAKAEEKIALETLENASALEKGKEVEIDDELLIENLAVSEKNLPQLLNLNILKYKKEKLDWLKRENDLYETVTNIRAALGLDKADSLKALDGLKRLLEMNLDPLMLKKHPMFFETLKRLKRYVGNVNEWQMNEAELKEFNVNAKEIRDLSEKVNKKFQDLFEYGDVDNFMEKFMEECKQLETDVKDLSEAEFFALHAEPNTRKYLMDQVYDNLNLKKT